MPLESTHTPLEFKSLAIFLNNITFFRTSDTDMYDCLNLKKCGFTTAHHKVAHSFSPSTPID